MAGQVGTGAVSYVLEGLEATSGVVPAQSLTDVLYVTANSIAATPDVIRKMVMAGSRAAERIIRPSKFKIHGGLTHPLTGNSGALSLMALLGLDTFLATVSGTATGVVTANGMSTFTNSGGTMALVDGAFATFGTGTTQECREIFKTTTPNLWTCKALTGPNAAGNVTTFSQLAQHKFGCIPASSAAVFTLPTVTLELNEGGQWAWRLTGCYMGKMNFKGGKEEVEISKTVVGTQMPVKLSRPGTYLPSVLAAPVAPVPTTATTGGTVAAGVYTVAVTYTNATGETVASATGTVTTTGATSTITIPSPAAETGATGWYAYVSQAGALVLYRQQTAGTPTAIGTALTLTAPPTATGANPLLVDTTGGLAPSWTAFAPTQQELNDVSQPFSINDGFALVPNDNYSVGESTFQVLPTIEDWEIDFDNGMLEKAFWDGSQVYKAYPGVQKATIKYKYATEAGRPDAYEDFLSQLKAVPIPFAASMVLNVGTPAAPAWHAAGLYVPSAVITKADVARSTGDVLNISVEADGLITQPGADLMNIFIVNDQASAYVGS